MEIKFIEHNSKEYEQMLALRIRVLLEPIGVPFSYINMESEKGDLLIGAFEEGQLIGCCVLTPKEASTIQLRQMVVDIPYQKKNIGAAIVSFAESVAQQKGFSFLMMHARNPVIPFYQKCGYTIVGREFQEVGIAHHKMQKQLIG